MPPDHLNSTTTEERIQERLADEEYRREFFKAWFITEAMIAIHRTGRTTERQQRDSDGFMALQNVVDVASESGLLPLEAIYDLAQRWKCGALEAIDLAIRDAHSGERG